MMSAAPKSVAKKVVAKKDVVVEVAVAAPAPVAAPAKAAKAPKAAAPAKAAPVVVASTPVEAAAAAAPAAPATTLDEDLKSVTAALNTVRETVVSLLAHVKKLDKRVHREIKDARKRKRRVKTEEGADAKPRTPSIFERPVQVTDELCVFLNLAKGTLISRSQVTKGVNAYVREKSLKDKHDIKPDAPLKKLLALPEGDKLTYFNLQRYLNRHYVKSPEALAAAAAKAAKA
jgi:chromatin remodeling complex protein RSC6